MTMQLFVPNRTSRDCGRNHFNPCLGATADQGQGCPGWPCLGGGGLELETDLHQEGGPQPSCSSLEGPRLSRSSSSEDALIENTSPPQERERGVDSALVCITQSRHRSRVRRGEWGRELSQVPHGLPHSGQSRA